jgi:manganese/iron transport system substrate-binding protein
MPRIPIVRLLAFTAIALVVAPAQAQPKPRLVIVCSTTQIADFTRQVVGDRCLVKSILAPGQDPHLYQITTADSQTVATADLCLDNGWHLEGKDWMRTLAVDAGKPIVSCVTGIEPYKLHEKDVPIPDPHAWFTPKNASVYVRNILHAVCERDPEHKEEYQARAALYLEQLRSLQQWIERQCNAIPANRRVLVTSHDAFNYFCREYGFKPTSPAGWSTGQEIGGGVTPARKRETVASIRALGVKAIFVETSVNPQLIAEIASEAGVKVGGQLYSDSMGAPGTAGETYLGMMRENVITIVHALK